MKARDIKKLKRAEQHRAMKQRDIRLEKSVEMALSGCSSKVLKAVSSTDYKMKMRSKPVLEGVTRENPEYRKVNNPYGQLTNARQKMRGCSIPLI